MVRYFKRGRWAELSVVLWLEPLVQRAHAPVASSCACCSSCFWLSLLTRRAAFTRFSVLEVRLRSREAGGLGVLGASLHAPRALPLGSTSRSRALDAACAVETARGIVATGEESLCSREDAHSGHGS